MAKGDDARARNQINYQNALAQQGLTNLGTRMIDQDRPMFHDAYRNAMTQQGADYNRLMGPQGYGGFAQTGGFTPQGIAAMRMRGNAANRGIMDTAMRNIQRFGGPGKTAALSRLGRDVGQGMSDTNIGTEANLASMIQQGRLQGLGGMLNTYGATPGLVNMYGNQLQQNMQQQLGLAGLQNQLGLGTMNAQIAASQIPGKWEHFAQRFKDIAGMGTTVMSGLQGLRGQKTPGDVFNQSQVPNYYPEGSVPTGAIQGIGAPPTPNYYPPGSVPPGQIQGIGAPPGSPIPAAGGAAGYPYIPQMGGSAPGIGGVTPSVSTSYELGIPGGQLPGAGNINSGMYGLPSRLPGAASSIQGLAGGSAPTLAGGPWAGASNIGSGMYSAPNAIASQGVSGAGGSSALGTAGYAALPAAAGALTYGIGEKGLFRGGEEGVKVNPSRDQLMRNFGDYNGMVDALAQRGVVGPQAEALMREMYDVKTHDAWKAFKSKFDKIMGWDQYYARPVGR